MIRHALLLLAASASLALADPGRSSANYQLVHETNTGASGTRSTSANYTLDDSGNSAASASTSANYAQKDGFAGQLTDPAALALSAASDPVGEESTVQLTADLVLDDDTIEADVTPAWSVVAGPLSGIDLAGLASTSTVYQNTTATAGASYLGLNAQLDFLVSDTDPDNFLTYAGDGLPDWWQVTHFGIDNPDAAPALDPDGDEQDNTYEYLAGFLPTDATSQLTTTLISLDTVQLSTVIPNRTYRLLRSFDLEIWKPTGATLMPAATLFDQLITDPAPSGNTSVFYKIEIED